jgi:hypothetical protein
LANRPETGEVASKQPQFLLKNRPSFLIIITNALFNNSSKNQYPETLKTTAHMIFVLFIALDMNVCNCAAPKFF